MSRRLNPCQSCDGMTRHDDRRCSVCRNVTQLLVRTLLETGGWTPRMVERAERITGWVPRQVPHPVGLVDRAPSWVHRSGTRR